MSQLPSTPVDPAFAAPEADFASFTEVSDAPANDSTPYSISTGDSFSGTLTAGSDTNDWIAIDMVAGDSYVITMDGGLGFDSYLGLYDDSGALLDTDDDGGPGRDSQITFTASTTGTYYIDAGSYQDNSTGGYEIEVEVFVPAPTGTYDEMADFLVNGYWDGNRASWHAFDTSSDNIITVDISNLTADGQQLARWAFEAWEMVADLEFVEVNNNADITFTDDDSGAYSSYTSTGHTTDSAIVNVSTDWIDAYGTTIDSYSFSTFVHEIGHALGLGHQGGYNGSATYGDDETFANDSWQLSIMSYFSQNDNSTVDASYAAITSAMLVDIIAIQTLYGAPEDTDTAGDTIYGVGSNLDNYLGALFEAALSTPDASVYGGEPITMTLYDEDGIDTLDLSTDSNDQTVTLASEGISDVMGLTGNLIIARDTVIENYTAGSGSDSVTGNAADNILIGNGGNDSLFGMAGDDTLIGGTGSDTMDGGDDTDTVSYASASGGVTARLNGGANSGQAAGDTISNVENLTGSGFVDNLVGNADANTLSGNGSADNLYGLGGNDTLNGDSGNDSLFGQAGADTLNGGLGNDTLEGGLGADVLDGGDGIDTASYASATGGVTARLNGGPNSGAAAGDTISNIENLAGSQFADNLVGDSDANTLSGNGGADNLYGLGGNDTLNGGNGNDSLFGQAGADTLNGGLGNDSLEGGTGSDTLDGGDGIDTASYSTATGGVTARLNGGANTGEATGDTISNIENLTGSRFADSLVGNSGLNTLAGAEGNDSLYGLGGNDTLDGGNGNDSLFGQADDDTLDGGNGNDVLAGGTGADSFIFNAGADTITDFTDDIDTLVIDRTALGLSAGATSADVLALASVVSGDIVIDFGSGNTLTLDGISNIASLSDDISFV